MKGRHEGPAEIEHGMNGPTSRSGGAADRARRDRLDVVFIGAPVDRGTSRPGARVGPPAIRATDYLPHDAFGPHLMLGVDPMAELRVADAGNVLINVRRFCQGLAGALLVVGPCIAVMGMMPGSV